MEAFFLPVFMLLFFFLIFVDIYRLHQLIVDIDLRPSLTQFLIIAMFTPIVLTTMNYYSQQENAYKLVTDHINTENIKFNNLKNKYIYLQMIIDDAKKNPTFYEKNTKFGSERFDNSVENFIKTFKEYEEIFNMFYINDHEIISRADSMSPVNFELYNLNIIFLSQLTNMYKTEHESKNFSIYFKTFEESYEKIEFKKIENLHTNLKNREEALLSYIKAVQAFYVFVGVLILYSIFRLILLYLKIHFIENILLNKIEKIHTIDAWTKAEQNVIYELKKYIFHIRSLDSISLRQIIKYKMNLWKFDKELSTIIHNEYIKKVENKCSILLKKI